MACSRRGGYCSAPVDQETTKVPEAGPGAEPSSPVGSRETTAQLVAATWDLVDAVFGHLRALGVSSDREELLAYGRQGLFEAAERFDPERGEDFRRFAYFRVRGAMLDGLRKMGSWSRRGYERVQLLRNAHATAEAAAEEQSSSQDTSADQAAERLRQHMANMATAMATGVFVEAAFDGTELISRDPALSAEDQLADQQVLQQMRQAIAELPDDEGEVVRRYYLEGNCLDDVAADWGCSKSWVSRVHTRAVKRLGVRLRNLR